MIPADSGCLICGICGNHRWFNAGLRLRPGRDRCYEDENEENRQRESHEPGHGGTSGERELSVTSVENRGRNDTRKHIGWHLIMHPFVGSLSAPIISQAGNRSEGIDMGKRSSAVPVTAPCARFQTRRFGGLGRPKGVISGGSYRRLAAGVCKPRLLLHCDMHRAQTGAAAIMSTAWASRGVYSTPRSVR